MDTKLCLFESCKKNNPLAYQRLVKSSLFFDNIQIGKNWGENKYESSATIQKAREELNKLAVPVNFNDERFYK